MAEAREAKRLERFGINKNVEVMDEEVRPEAMESKSDICSEDPPDSPPGGLKHRLKAKYKAKIEKFKSKINRTKPW